MISTNNYICFVIIKTQKPGDYNLGPTQGNPDRYSYSGENYHKSYINQGDRWVIKFRLGLNLFDLINWLTPLGGYEEEIVRWRWSQDLFCSWMRAHGAWWLFLDLDIFESRERLLGFVTGICREGRWNFADQRTNVHKKLCTLPND